MALFKLPRIQARTAITDSSGKALTYFTRFWDEFAKAIENQVNDIISVQQDIQSLQTVQAQQIAQIQTLLGIAAATNQAAQAAQASANDAQATADDALGAGAVSGSANNPVIDVPFGGGWIAGPQVNLTGVVAGDLTIGGTGPVQDGDVVVTGDPLVYRTFSGQFRVVEDDGGPPTTVFTGSMSAYQAGGAAFATVSNDSSATVSAFALARTNTGAVSYRLDFQSSAGDLESLKGYLYVRRAA